MPSPKVSRDAKRVVRLLIERDVVRPIEPDDKVAFDFIFGIASGVRISEHGQAEFSARRTQSFDVFDLCFDGCEMAHLILSWLMTG
jgi:hypothetical protein